MAISMEDVEARARELGVDLTTVDIDSITLPAAAIDDDPCSDDAELLLVESKVGPPPDQLETGFANVIVVDNLPIIPVGELQRLEIVVRMIYSHFGEIRDGGFWIPVFYTTYGYCFIEYTTPQAAQLARQKTDMYSLDMLHTLRVTTFDDFEKYMEVPDVWTAPAEIKPYTPGPNLHRWLTDEKARDQFVIRAGACTEVYWNGSMPELVYQKQYWTDSIIQWSPLGTYLVTVHRQGVQVWGGDDGFKRVMRFAHPQVQRIDFSPGERYLVTCSSLDQRNPSGDTQRMVVLNIFDVRTGKVVWDYKGSADELTPGASISVSWPIFRWSGGRNDKYFARLGKDTLYVYETATFSLLDNKSLEIENVVDFSWSPTDPIVCLLVQESGGGRQPARVSLVRIPSKEELRHKNLSSVSGCKMYWQNNGEYLAIQVDRYTNTTNNNCTGFEMFRIKERETPVEVFELDNKDENIVTFEWEPRGHRFAIIHGDGTRHDISFYSMCTTDNVSLVLKLITLEAKQDNALFWSPAGQFAVLAGLKGFNGQLEFLNVDDLETMAREEHFMATHIMWDPTGRFVATAVTSDDEMENGFQIWSFAGKQIYKVSKEQFYQFQWRPRPPSLLTPEKEAGISTL